MFFPRYFRGFSEGFPCRGHIGTAKFPSLKSRLIVGKIIPFRRGNFYIYETSPKITPRGVYIENHSKAHQGAAFATTADALSIRAWVEIRNNPESPPANHPRFFNSSSVFDPGPKGPDKADGKKYNRALKMQAPKKLNENVWYPQFGIFEAKLHRFLRFIVRIYSLICAQSKSDLIL